MIKAFTYGAQEKAIISLYQSVGWSSYLTNQALLAPSFENSLLLLGAFVKDELVGFIRCVGDGHHIVLIQDLLVHPNFQKQGFGRQLLQEVFATYSHVRMLQLNTDLNDQAANSFYQSMGMVPIADGQMISYFKPVTPPSHLS